MASINRRCPCWHRRTAGRCVFLTGPRRRRENRHGSVYAQRTCLVDADRSLSSTLAAAKIGSAGWWMDVVTLPGCLPRATRFEVAHFHRLGLEARHILCRWREPPDDKKHCDSGLKGRHIRPCVGPPGLRFLMSADRWLTPPALDLSTLRA
jgi:hypothetical protein